MPNLRSPIVVGDAMLAALSFTLITLVLIILLMSREQIKIRSFVYNDMLRDIFHPEKYGIGFGQLAEAWVKLSLVAYPSGVSGSGGSVLTACRCRWRDQPPFSPAVKSPSRAIGCPVFTGPSSGKSFDKWPKKK